MADFIKYVLIFFTNVSPEDLTSSRQIYEDWEKYSVETLARE